jgi:ADP-ribose pyrophosphatase
VSIYQTVQTTYLWQSQWYSLRQDRLLAPDGHEFTYTIVDHPGAVWVVPVTTDGQVVLIYQYRYPVDDWCWEVPAGGMPPRLDLVLDQSQRASGSRLVQSEKAARRELLEEVGGEAAELRYVGQFYTSNGISNEVAYVYLATGVELGKAQREPTELMEVRQVPVEEALRMAREGEITDGPSALALLSCEQLL